MSTLKRPTRRSKNWRENPTVQDEVSDKISRPKNVHSLTPLTYFSPSICQKAGKYISVFLFLLFWVANGELLQAISLGSLPNMASIGYNQPAFITWFSYNFMMLSFPLFVVPTFWCKCQANGTHSHLPILGTDSGESEHSISRKQHCFQTFHEIMDYYQNSWPGIIGFRFAALSCLCIVYLLHLLNISMIVGLECISVPLSNAIFQLQTVFCVGLSILWLKDSFHRTQIFGIIFALLGICLIVLPPLLRNDEKGEQLTSLSTSSTCRSTEYPMILGIIVTLVSSAIGGSYLVSWRIFDEQRKFSHALTPWEGLVHTQMTLAMLGTLNLFAGWPIVFVAQSFGLEDFQWPSQATWAWLIVNGLAEFLFDASCAVAIYTTSPVIVAIASPLTICISMFFESLVTWSYLSEKEFSNTIDEDNLSNEISMLAGTVVLLYGTFLIEQPPKGQKA